METRDTFSIYFMQMVNTYLYLYFHTVLKQSLLNHGLWNHAESTISKPHCGIGQNISLFLASYVCIYFKDLLLKQIAKMYYVWLYIARMP